MKTPYKSNQFTPRRKRLVGAAASAAILGASLFIGAGSAGAIVAGDHAAPGEASSISHRDSLMVDVLGDAPAVDSWWHGVYAVLYGS
jgi:hypothetical protein